MTEFQGAEIHLPWLPDPQFLYLAIPLVFFWGLDALNTSLMQRAQSFAMKLERIAVDAIPLPSNRLELYFVSATHGTAIRIRDKVFPFLRAIFFTETMSFFYLPLLLLSWLCARIFR